MAEYDIVKARHLIVRIVEPANSMSGARGQLAVSGSRLYLHDGTIYQIVGGV